MATFKQVGARSYWTPLPSGRKIVRLYQTIEVTHPRDIEYLRASDYFEELDSAGNSLADSEDRYESAITVRKIKGPEADDSGLPDSVASAQVPDPAEAVTKVASEKVTEVSSDIDLDSMSMVDLKELADKLSIPHRRSKDDMVAAIREYQDQSSDD